MATFCAFFFFNDTATTEIYTLSYTTLFRSEGRVAVVSPRRGPGDGGRGRHRRSTVDLRLPLCALRHPRLRAAASRGRLGHGGSPEPSLHGPRVHPHDLSRDGVLSTPPLDDRAPSPHHLSERPH